MSLIKKTPLAVSGLALSLAALGNLLSPHGETIRFVLAIFSTITFGLFFAKLILDYDKTKEELKNPVVLSGLPTSTQALMLFTVYMQPFLGPVAVYVWYVIIAAHILIMLTFVKRFVFALKLQTVFPSWFIISAGIVTASLTSPAMGAIRVGQAIFYVGFVLYPFTLSVIIYRLIKFRPLPEPARPTIAVFTAPMSMCLAGYLAAFEQPNALLVYFMLTITVISYIYVSVNMVFLLRLKFYPTYAAFTFPYVISAIAFNVANTFLLEKGYGFFSFAPIVSKCVAVIIVTYVLIRYTVSLCSKSGEL